MKYSKSERLDIGKQLYEKSITRSEAIQKYGISPESANRYAADYKKANGLSAPDKKLTQSSPAQMIPSKNKSMTPDIEAYMAMSKEELINELILAKANELRAKKGYEVKGVGVNKEFIPINGKNSKS